MENEPKVPHELEAWIGAWGKVYTGKQLPEGMSRGPMGHCFDNCALRASMRRDLRYVEGIAALPGQEWKLHAWLTDGIHAYDPTWYAVNRLTKKEVQHPAIYIGIELPIEKVLTFMRRTQYQAVIANGWRDPITASMILPPRYPIDAAKEYAIATGQAS